MVDKINQSMLSLAENNKDFKTALRFMLKCEIQLLLDRLAELGDESLLVIANKSEESTSHFGSACAETYLKACNGFMNFSIKDTFLKHCLQTTPAAGLHTKSIINDNAEIRNSCMGNVPDAGQSQEQGTVNDVMLRAAAMLQMGHNQANMMNRHGMGMPSHYGRQPPQTNRFHPYQQQSNHHTGSSQKQSNTKKQENIERKRAICRHFARGFCWQDNVCAFLHVHQEPDSSEDKDTKDKKTIDSTTDFTKDSKEDTASSSAFGSGVK